MCVNQYHNKVVCLYSSLTRTSILRTNLAIQNSNYQTLIRKVVTLATGKKIIFQIISDLNWGSLFYQFNFQIEFQLVFFFFFLRLKELLEFKSSPFSIDGRIKKQLLTRPCYCSLYCHLLSSWAVYVHLKQKIKFIQD